MTLRISKEIFKMQSITSVILPYFSTPDVCENFMTQFNKKSKQLWIDNRSKWLK